MIQVPRDVLAYLFGVLAGLSDPTSRLMVALVAFGLVPGLPLFVLKRWSLVHAQRVASISRAFRQIWAAQHRRPVVTVDSTARLVEETDSNPLTAGLCWLAWLALTLWWWGSALLGWSERAFRYPLGQALPTMFGVPLTPEIGWAVDEFHAVAGVYVATLLLIPWLVAVRTRMVSRRLADARGRSSLRWYADPRFVVALALGLAVVTLADLMLWQRVTLLLALAYETVLTRVVLGSIGAERPVVPIWVHQLQPLERKPRAKPMPVRPAQNARPGYRPVVATAPLVSATSRMGTTFRQYLSRADAKTQHLRSAFADQRGDAGTWGTPDSWAAHAPAVEPLREGDRRRISGYAVRGRLGAGGMSVVYAGTQRQTGDEVAIKVIRDVADPPGGQARLLREMEALAAGTGPHTVRIITVGHDGDDHFLVMERLRGPNLWNFVNRYGPIRNQQALTHLAFVLAAGLADFHAKGVTHRDLKPANIVLTDQGPVIVDLGIAKMADATATLPGQGFATLGYVAPETILGRGAMSTADVWSWGCCLAYAASGQRLFLGDEWDAAAYRVLNGQRNQAALDGVRVVSPQLADLVVAATEREPERRPVNGGMLLRRLPPSISWPRPRQAIDARALRDTG